MHIIIESIKVCFFIYLRIAINSCLNAIETFVKLTLLGVYLVGINRKTKFKNKQVLFIVIKQSINFVVVVLIKLVK